MHRLLTIALIAATPSLVAQKHLPGGYQTPWGANLILGDDSTFTYRSFECYHMVSANGDWSYAKDTLYLTTRPKAGYDSLVSVEQSLIPRFTGTRIVISDLDSTQAFFTYVTIYSGGQRISLSTDTLGYVDVPATSVDSIRVISSEIIKIGQSTGNNLICLTFFNINYMDTEDFNKRPFLVDGKKLYFVYKDGISRKKYFKKS